jgi:hypothetical protein
VSVVIDYYYCHIKRRYFETTGRWFDDEQRYSTYSSVEKAVVASLADGEYDATFDIPIAASAPPWAAQTEGMGCARGPEIPAREDKQEVCAALDDGTAPTSLARVPRAGLRG